MAMRPAAVNDPEGVAFEHPAPDQDDPNEAYDVVPMKSVAHGPAWRLVDRHQEWHSRPALFGGPEGRERYATAPAHRAAIRGQKKAHDRGRA